MRLPALSSLKFNPSWLFAVVAVVFFGMACKVLFNLVHHVHLADISRAIANISVERLVCAVAAMLLAYGILPLYDILAVRSIGSHLPSKKIIPASMTAYAMGHMLGVAMLSAGAVRYRFYKSEGLSNLQIANLVWLVSLAFGMGIVTLAAISLILQPTLMMNLLGHVVHLPKLLIQAIGVLLLLGILGVFVLAGQNGRYVTIYKWSFGLPPMATLTRQLIVAIADIFAVALILYALFPVNSVSYLAVLHAFVQSNLLAIISHVPGGIGVFEFGMATAFPNIPTATLLAILLIYRLIYFITPFLLGLILLLWHELQLAKNNQKATTYDNYVSRLRAISPVPMSISAFVFGIGFIISALLPNHFITQSIKNFHYPLFLQYLPTTIAESSRLMAFIIGFLLLVTTTALFKRMYGAWRLVSFIVLCSLVTTLVIRPTIMSIVIHTFFLLWLLWAKSAFYRHEIIVAIRWTPSWFMWTALSLISCYWFTLFLYSTTAHQPNFTAHQIHLLHHYWTIGSKDWATFWQVSQLLLLVFMSFLLFNLLRSTPIKAKAPSAKDIMQMQNILIKNHQQVESLTLKENQQLWFSTTRQSFLVYELQQHRCIIQSQPIGQAEEFDSMQEQLVHACIRSGLSPILYQKADHDMFDAEEKQ
ncbi:MULTISPECIES: flippase-like domain-containing protein [unclassified Acinetobacter]|uniref:flippase-like domain-containing protein n=1 Tax=unclassified Acinetobacter TaxID=196816 RepID=UPI0035B9BB4A